MDYSRLIVKKKHYKYSANICFDLRNEEKLSEFIPNGTTVEILREYIGGIISGSTNIHSRILYGSYGTGKSHLLTVLGDLLGQINTSGNGFRSFVELISEYDKDLGHDIARFVKKNKPYLIVPVYSEFNDFGKCISYSIKKELNRNGINVTFKGFYEEASLLINKWSEGKESFFKLREVCKQLDLKVSDLEKGLATYDSAYESIFEKVYEGMSYGATFNASNSSLIDNMEAANNAIRDLYAGMLIIFDEFGRYVEDNGEKIKIKQIQDLAEYCDHSNYSDYLILVSHKQLSMYTGQMQKAISEEWTKVEGRFKATSINVKYDQCLSLIKHIIPKSKLWDKFAKKNAEQLNNLYNQAWDFKGFLLPPNSNDGNPFEGGYPLHPITLYALDRLSKKVAQNERTFFTYLAGDEECSLDFQLRQLDLDEFHFIGLDSIYDYFETNIKTYKTDESYTTYKKLQHALSKISDGKDSLPKRILKVMAVIAIIADSDIIIADNNTILNVIDAPKMEIQAALDTLVKLKVIRFMRQYEYYDFFDSSSFDFEKNVAEKMENINDDMVTTTLNEDFRNFVIYPYLYNSTYHMNRVFFPMFINRNDLEKKAFRNSLPKYYDGILGLVLDNGGQSDDYRELDVPDRMIIIVNSNARDIKAEVKRYIALKYFYSIKDELVKDEPTIIKELSMYLAEQHAIIEEIVTKWRSFDSKNLFSLYEGIERKISSEKELTELASEIMNKEFASTLKVNNDLLNKNLLSGAIKLARKKVVNNILSFDDIFKECTVLSPEHNIIRSVLAKNGIVDDTLVPIRELNTLLNNTSSAKPVMEALNRFLRLAEKAPVSLASIYEKLKLPPFGLRDGYIPVLLAFALKKYENVSLYFHGVERDYTDDELIRALENSEDYTIYICNWNAEELAYIHELEKIFIDYITVGKYKNRLKILFDAMNTHYSSISKSARTTEIYISTIAKQYRSILNASYSDYNKFFFEILPKIHADLSELSIILSNIKLELENVDNKVRIDVLKSIRRVMKINNDVSITAAFQKKYRSDWSKKEKKIFDYMTNSFLDYISNVQGSNDEKFISEISKLLTGFEIEYWSDNKVEEFEQELERIVNKLRDYKPLAELTTNETKVTIESGGGTKIVSQFGQAEFTPTGKTLYNKLTSTLNNFGQSISLEEKLNIIAKIMKENIRE